MRCQPLELSELATAIWTAVSVLCLSMPLMPATDNLGGTRRPCSGHAHRARSATRLGSLTLMVVQGRSRGRHHSAHSVRVSHGDRERAAGTRGGAGPPAVDAGKTAVHAPVRLPMVLPRPSSMQPRPRVLASSTCLTITHRSPRSRPDTNAERFVKACWSGCFLSRRGRSRATSLRYFRRFRCVPTPSSACVRARVGCGTLTKVLEGAVRGAVRFSRGQLDSSDGVVAPEDLSRVAQALERMEAAHFALCQILATARLPIRNSEKGQAPRGARAIARCDSDSARPWWGVTGAPAGQGSMIQIHRPATTFSCGCAACWK